MRTVLGRKQNLSPDGEDLWWDVIDHIEDYVSREELAEWEEKTKARIRETISGKAAGYSWSGGKDSIVLAGLCKDLGITKSQCLITDLEYPAWRKWMEENRPDGCELVYVGFDLDFLAENQDLIFANGKTKQKWNRLVQRSHFLEFMANNNLDVLMIGHRTIDGNFCGKNGIVERKSGEILFAPLYDWPHEVIFAYMRYHGIEIPFIYRWYRGFYEGTHWWPYRYADSVEQGYREVYDIDPSVVIAAAEKIDSARAFLEKEVRA